MRYIVPLEKKHYLHELRQQLGSLTDVFSERFTGIILGNFIYITHHAGYEWNRRITSEMSHGIGFVTKHKEGCAVNVLFTRGCLDPLSMVFTYLFCLLVFFIKGYGQLDTEAFWLSATVTVACGLLSYFMCWVTERGQAGMFELYSLLQDPKRFWTDYDEE